MRKIILAGLGALALLTPTPAPVDASTPGITVTAWNPDAVTIDVPAVPAAEWAVRDSGSACTGSATITDQNSVQQTYPFDSTNWQGDYPPTFQITLPSPEGIASLDSASATCDLSARQAYRVTVTATGQVHRYGVQTYHRFSWAYGIGGNCNWGGDGFSGLISTCLVAHARATYYLPVPRGKTFVAVGHRVTSGIAPCRNKRWQIVQAGPRSYIARFSHGSASAFSQCDVQYVALHYKYKKTVTRYRTVYATVTGTWSAP